MAKTIRFNSKFRIIVQYSIRFDSKWKNTIRTALLNKRLLLLRLHFILCISCIKVLPSGEWRSIYPAPVHSIHQFLIYSTSVLVFILFSCLFALEYISYNYVCCYRRWCLRQQCRRLWKGWLEHTCDVQQSFTLGRRVNHTNEWNRSSTWSQSKRRGW